MPMMLQAVFQIAMVTHANEVPLGQHTCERSEPVD